MYCCFIVWTVKFGSWYFVWSEICIQPVGRQSWTLSTYISKLYNLFLQASELREGHLKINVLLYLCSAVHWFTFQRKIKAPSPPPLDEDDSRRGLVESDQEEMVQASDSEMQVQLHYSFSLLSRKFFTCSSKYSETYIWYFSRDLIKRTISARK